MAAATAWRMYREFKDALGEKIVNLETDTIKCALFQSTSNCGDVALATAQYATLTNQVANQGAPGYETGGKTVATTWTQTGGTATLGCANPSWVATGGSIVARFAVLYSDTMLGHFLWRDIRQLFPSLVASLFILVLES